MNEKKKTTPEQSARLKNLMTDYRENLEKMADCLRQLDEAVRQKREEFSAMKKSLSGLENSIEQKIENFIFVYHARTLKRKLIHLSELPENCDVRPLVGVIRNKENTVLTHKIEILDSRYYLTQETADFLALSFLLELGS